MWNDILKSISQVGYNLGLGGYGISRPVGSAYFPNLTPDVVYSTNAAVTPERQAESQVLDQKRIPTYQPITGGSTGGGTGSTGGAQTQPSTPGTPSNAPGGKPGGFRVPGGPSAEDISAIYNPLFEELNQQEAAIPGQQKTQEELVNQQLSDAQKAIAGQRALTGEGYTAAEGTVNRQLESGLSEAIRAYNALRQQGISRFGGASSAGAAIGELAQQEFARQQGALQMTTQEQIADLVRQKNQANLFYDQETNAMQRDANAQLAKIRSDFSDKLAAVRANRALAESEKTQLRLNMLQQIRENAAAIHNQINQNKLALDTWKYQHDVELRDKLNLATQNYAAEISNDFFDRMNSIQGEVQNIGPGSAQVNRITPRYNPNKDDELNTLLF